MQNFNAFDWVATLLLVVGGINWGLIGAFNIDLVSFLFGEMTTLSRVVYTLVGLSAVYAVINALFVTSTATSDRVVYQ